ncbi:hypothetical protein EJ05DRAFT_501424 [Pseudovirgaria hyperparasitica]|uniref:Uncharacterized protein n=1 Tax=Pseudovirgaria hyperparasitica TaxID=470096 RepID=A0A6A6W4M7_9PEZI|nr:uncharacterized protein EJ05DRAFT_501424 [Pseudovirgaria hyperparasitica]KAF2756870.1 hypothetical protein EJ05DRAFT_501424 [Pseudovirgaria hyperparasitica]
MSQSGLKASLRRFKSRFLTGFRLKKSKRSFNVLGVERVAPVSVERSMSERMGYYRRRAPDITEHPRSRLGVSGRSDTTATRQQNTHSRIASDRTEIGRAYQTSPTSTVRGRIAFTRLMRTDFATAVPKIQHLIKNTTSLSESEKRRAQKRLQKAVKLFGQVHTNEDLEAVYLKLEQFYDKYSRETFDVSEADGSFTTSSQLYGYDDADRRGLGASPIGPVPGNAFSFDVQRNLEIGSSPPVAAHSSRPGPSNYGQRLSVSDRSRPTGHASPHPYADSGINDEAREGRRPSLVIKTQDAEGLQNMVEPAAPKQSRKILQVRQRRRGPQINASAGRTYGYSPVSSNEEGNEDKGLHRPPSPVDIRPLRRRRDQVHRLSNSLPLRKSSPSVAPEKAPSDETVIVHRLANSPGGDETDIYSGPPPPVFRAGSFCYDRQESSQNPVSRENARADAGNTSGAQVSDGRASPWKPFRSPTLQKPSTMNDSQRPAYRNSILDKQPFALHHAPLPTHPPPSPTKSGQWLRAACHPAPPNPPIQPSPTPNTTQPQWKNLVQASQSTNIFSTATTTQPAPSSPPLPTHPQTPASPTLSRSAADNLRKAAATASLGLTLLIQILEDHGTSPGPSFHAVLALINEFDDAGRKRNVGRMCDSLCSLGVSASRNEENPTTGNNYGGNPGRYYHPNPASQKPNYPTPESTDPSTNPSNLHKTSFFNGSVLEGTLLQSTPTPAVFPSMAVRQGGMSGLRATSASAGNQGANAMGLDSGSGEKLRLGSQIEYEGESQLYEARVRQLLEELSESRGGEEGREGRTLDYGTVGREYATRPTKPHRLTISPPRPGTPIYQDCATPYGRDFREDAKGIVDAMGWVRREGSGEREDCESVVSV